MRMLDSLDSDIVIRFASYLCSQDLLNLSLTCRRFGSKNEGLSLMEDTAMQIVNNSHKDERNAIPKLANQTYIELYSELEKYREPRMFDQLLGNSLSYVNDDKSHIKYNGSGGEPISTAICNHVMSAGKHYATFTMNSNSTDENTLNSLTGIIRPLKNWDKKGLESFDPLDRGYFDELQKERTERWSGDVNYCGFHTNYSNSPGHCVWSSWQGAISGEFGGGGIGNVRFSLGDEIGLLLDLDVGTLSVYKNGRRVCVMKDGLSGEYCWCGVISSGQLRIEKGPIPRSIVGESLGFILNNSNVKIPGDEQGRTFGDVAKFVATKNGEQLDGFALFDGDLFGKEIGWEKKNIDSNLGRLKKKGSDKKSRRIDNDKPGEYPQFWYVDGLRPGLDDYKVFILS